MKRPLESEYTSHVGYTRALEDYCNQLEKAARQALEALETVLSYTENWPTSFAAHDCWKWDKALSTEAITALQSALSQQAPSQLKWCHHCGEGVTTFCRGSLNKCPLELNKIVAQGETK